MAENDTLIKLTINGTEHQLSVKRRWTLLYLLREVLGLTGTKYGCGTNDCGACKVLLDGEAVNSCVVLARNLEGKKVVTIEGLQEDGRLNVLQQAFVEAGAIQCGFCTPGMIISATALLELNRDPSEEEIREALDGNFCRCTGYVNIVKAIRLAADRMAGSMADRSTAKEATNG
jgi:aerobic carbon-monoxide dehydrogenase small subunit